MKERPDLILSYWIYPDSYAALRSGEALRIPVVVGSRGSDLKVREQSSTVREKIRYTVSHAAAVLTVSRDLADTAAALGAHGARIHSVINGVDRHVFQPLNRIKLRERLNVDAGVRQVLFVGRLVAMKGVAELIQAIATLNGAEPGRWRVAIVGEGSQDGELRRQAGSRDLLSSVLMLGTLSPKEIADWMNAADLFCLPSASEGCPNVIREALSCGCPVVATAVGGIPELLDETTGVLITDNTSSSLAAGLAKAIEVPWDRTAIAMTRQRSWEQVAKETYAVCESVMRKSRRGDRVLA
jgi:glycosyltransferase involved in cell wall biosynthesis